MVPKSATSFGYVETRSELFGGAGQPAWPEAKNSQGAWTVHCNFSVDEEMMRSEALGTKAATSRIQREPASQIDQ